MDDIVPIALQRLRAADIIRLAGLAVASLGQEYCRIGAVQATIRRGAQLSGIVDMSHVGNEAIAFPVNRGEVAEHVSPERRRYAVDVNVLGSDTWFTHCTCSPDSPAVCAHATALLYQWLANPLGFVTTTREPGRPTSTSSLLKRAGSSLAGEKTAHKSLHAAASSNPVTASRGSLPIGDLSDILSQMGLSELRNMAREYDISPTGLSKQQLADAIVRMLEQPEVVRKVAAALEKPPRQLLATLTLAGGSIKDDNLRSLFERFGFGTPDMLQDILVTLQNKGLLFHTNLTSEPQQRIGLRSSLLDIGWCVPMEVRAALRVSVPVVPFSIEKEVALEKDVEEEQGLPTIHQVKPYSLLPDLLLVARALDGCQIEPAEVERKAPSRTLDELAAIEPPKEYPSASFIERLQAIVPRSSLFLRYAIRLLRLADILHRDDAGTSSLRLLPNAARLLLGPTSFDAARDLFELWLTQPGYDELYDLHEEGLRLRYRTNSLNHSLLRNNELEEENCEARRSLVALVALAPLNQWISFLPFARFVYRLNPTFLQKRPHSYSPPSWWIEQQEGQPLQPEQMGDWIQAEGHYLARLLRGPLHWWGITDLALSPGGRLLAFRLIPMAGVLLKGEEAGMPVFERDGIDASSASSLIEALETDELLVSCTAAAWPLLELIEDFAEVAGVRNNRLCYRLAPKSLTAAMSRVQRPAALLGLLRQIEGGETRQNSPLPQMVAQLERWTANYGRVRLYTGVSLLEVADSLVMRELAMTTSVEEQIVQNIQPTLMILKKQGTERLLEDLKRRGQTPLLHEED
jgi:hypothetical protein